MKKYFKIILLTGLCLGFVSSCSERYLDKAPKAGLSEEEVFSKYENFMQFFNTVYYGDGNYNIRNTYPFYFLSHSGKFGWTSLTELADNGRILHSQNIKKGINTELKWFSWTGDRNILTSMFRVIRRCNMTLEHISMLNNAKQEDIDDLIAQAHFVRAYATFNLFLVWGRMPYITKVLGPDDQWDMPRLSDHETCLKVAADCDTAAMYFEKAGRMRRDPKPGGDGHLNHPDQFRPNGVAAKAFKARALLYAASPLNNELGIQDWEEAAKANWEAIQIALQYGYALLPGVDYKSNFVGPKYTNEQLWGYNFGAVAYNQIQGMQDAIFANSKSASSGLDPAQSCVDKFETRWGDPLNTKADRDAATALGHYNEQDPYANRDPRFYIDIIYNTAPIPVYGTAKIYYENVGGKIVYSELQNQEYLGRTHTGYIARKLWGGQSTINRITPNVTDPIIRLAETYLNYAEASNEAYGPNTIGVPGATLTAVQAINLIRARIGQPDVLPAYTGSTKDFRPRIKNERTIELLFEEYNYYFDIRRWKDVTELCSGVMYGMDIEKVPVSAMYPTGYKYTRLPLEAARQCAWKDEMYYFAFPVEDMYKMKNFVPNPTW